MNEKGSLEDRPLPCLAMVSGPELDAAAIERLVRRFMSFTTPAGRLVANAAARGVELTAWEGERLGAVRAVLDATARLGDEWPDLAITWTHAPLTLDSERIAAAAESWKGGKVPVHDLVGFDFAVAGHTPPTMTTIGLKALVGQEIVARPFAEAQRQPIARLMARLANEMLASGAIRRAQSASGHGLVDGKVRLQPDFDRQTVEVVVSG